MSLFGAIKTILEHFSAFCRKKRSTVKDIAKLKRLTIIINHKKQHDQTREQSAAPAKGAKGKKKDGPPEKLTTKQTEKGQQSTVAQDKTGKTPPAEDRWRGTVKKRRARINLFRKQARSRRF